MNRCGSIRPWISRSRRDLEPGEALRLRGGTSHDVPRAASPGRESRLARWLGGVDDAFASTSRFSGGSWPRFRSARAARGRGLARRAGVAGSACRFRLGRPLGAGLAARVLPSLHWTWRHRGCRGHAGETDGWISLIGSAAQWIRVTRAVVTWAGLVRSLGASTIRSSLARGALAGVATCSRYPRARVGTRSGSRAS